MEEILSFKTMITPTIVRVLFVIVSAILMITGLVLFFQDAVLAGLATMIVGPLLTRVYCELIILGFRMNETLNEISSSMGASGANDSYATWSTRSDAQKPAWLARQSAGT